jgi:uncharacterized protein YdaU (DUF1376 family)
VNYYEHHIGDYAEATGHLTFVEDAAYSRLIRKYYATERPIPADLKQAQRLVGARTREERAAVEQVLSEFFELRDDGWHQARCDEGIADYVAGEPEREQKRINKDTRLKRHRLIRAAFFEALRSSGQHPAWDMKTEALRELVRRSGFDPEALAATAIATLAATQPATAPATPATATQSPDTSHQSPVPNPQTPETGKPVAAAAAARATKATRLAVDWQLPKAWGEWALSEYPQWTAEKVRLEGAKFADHWRAKPGKAGTALDWLAVWRNWCRSDIAHRDDPKPNGRGAQPQSTEQRNAEAKRLLFGTPATPETPQEAIGHA